MTALAFLDTETTGLYEHAGHEVWEVGLILRRDSIDEGGEEYVWQLPVDLARADPMALRIGRFHERRWPTPVGADNYRVAKQGTWDDHPGLSVCRLDEEAMPEWAATFMALTDGAHLVGAVPSFDERFLAPLLRRWGACPSWHYHLIDCEALAAGAAQSPPPWDSEELSNEVGVDPEKFDRHTALGDARWAMAVYDAVVNAPMKVEG